MKSGECIYVCVCVYAEEEYLDCNELQLRIVRGRGFNIKSNDVAKVRS